MKRSKFNEPQIVAILKEQEVGLKVAETCRTHGISAATFYKWRSRYGGMDGSLLKRVYRVYKESALNLRIKPKRRFPLPTVMGSTMFGNGVAWPIAWPTLAVFVSLIGATVLSLATEGKQRRFIRKAFEHYLSPAAIERVIADPSLLRLGGERREVTVMFVDLAGFASVAERLDPPILSGLLKTTSRG